MSRSDLAKALAQAWPADSGDVPECVSTVIDAIAARIIADGHVNVPGLGSFNVIYSSDNPYGVGFMACGALTRAAKERHAPPEPRR